GRGRGARGGGGGRRGGAGAGAAGLAASGKLARKRPGRVGERACVLTLAVAGGRSPAGKGAAVGLGRGGSATGRGRCDVHPGWYSNSVVPIRTVSPGATPASSSARLNPKRSSPAWNLSKPSGRSRSVLSRSRSTAGPDTSHPQSRRQTCRVASRTGLRRVRGARWNGSGRGADLTASARAATNSSSPAPVIADTG